MKKLIVFLICLIFLVVGCSKGTPNGSGLVSEKSSQAQTKSSKWLVSPSNSVISANKSTEKSVGESKENSKSNWAENSQNSSSLESLASSSKEDSSGEGENNTPQINQVESYISPLNSNAKTKIVSTIYQTADTVICDAVATDYGADKTGVKDSTSAIQSAINQVSQNGGGTVFLPAGQYLVTGEISLPQYVTLRGDWQNPEIDNPAYGTIILAKPTALGSLKPYEKPLFKLSGHSGVEGLTFYYTEQNINGVIDYGYTIYADSPVTTTIKNVTFLNSVYGIGISLKTNYNELCNVENLYGTFLKNALTHNATTDVGFYNNLNLSPKYWINATKGFACQNSQKLNEYISNNLEGLVLGDLDDQLIANVKIDRAKIGIKFTTGIRADAGFWGLVNNAQINAETGVYADYLNGRSGVVFTNSSLGKVVNNSPVGVIKTASSTAEFSGLGTNVVESGSVDLSKYNMNFNLSYPKHTKLYIAEGLTSGGMVDNTEKLNQILKGVSSSGGVVVVPNGIYRLNGKVTIPKNVELRSSQGVFSRTNQSQNGKNGVVFVSYVSGETFNLEEGAGLRGVRIWLAKNDFKNAKTALDNSSAPNDVAVKGLGCDVYALNNEIVGAYVGFDFSNCNRHILNSNYGICYKNFIVAGGENGVISSCLSNPNFMTRSNLYDYFDSANCNVNNWKAIRNSGESNEDFAILRDGIGRTYTTMISLKNPTNQKIFNTFCYGEAGFCQMVGGSAVLLNTSLDYIPNDKCVYTLEGGEMVIVGSLRVYGISLGYKSGRLKAYGRIGFGVTKEKAFDSAISTVDEIEYVGPNAVKQTLFDCDTKGLNASLNTNSSFVKQGSGSWKINVSGGNANLSGSFTAKDLSKFSKGYLHCYIYCEDINNVGGGQIEISSSGTCDSNELNWSFEQYVVKTGWNELYLPISSAGTTGGAIDLSKVNYFRIYALNGNTNYYIDNIEFITD